MMCMAKLFGGEEYMYDVLDIQCIPSEGKLINIRTNDDPNQFAMIYSITKCNINNEINNLLLSENNLTYTFAIHKKLLFINALNKIEYHGIIKNTQGNENAWHYIGQTLHINSIICQFPTIKKLLTNNDIFLINPQHQHAACKILRMDVIKMPLIQRDMYQPQVDMYLLGCLLYEIITKQMYVPSYDPIVFNQSVITVLLDLLERLLTYDKSKRITQKELEAHFMVDLANDKAPLCSIECSEDDQKINPKNPTRILSSYQSTSCVVNNVANVNIKQPSTVSKQNSKIAYCCSY